MAYNIAKLSFILIYLHVQAFKNGFLKARNLYTSVLKYDMNKELNVLSTDIIEISNALGLRNDGNITQVINADLIFPWVSDWKNRIVNAVISDFVYNIEKSSVLVIKKDSRIIFSNSCEKLFFKMSRYYLSYRIHLYLKIILC